MFQEIKSLESWFLLNYPPKRGDFFCCCYEKKIIIFFFFRRRFKWLTLEELFFEGGWRLQYTTQRLQMSCKWWPQSHTIICARFREFICCWAWFKSLLKNGLYHFFSVRMWPKEWKMDSAKKMWRGGREIGGKLEKLFSSKRFTVAHVEAGCLGSVLM